MRLCGERVATCWWCVIYGVWECPHHAEHEWDDRGYPHFPRCVKCGAPPPSTGEPDRLDP